MSARDREKLIRECIRARDGYRKAVIESRRAYEELPFDNLTQQQRRSVISLMVWLALDVSAADENIWLDELIENVVAQDNWQDLILDRIPIDERPTIINLPPHGCDA
jgi:hypothetical protein